MRELDEWHKHLEDIKKKLRYSDKAYIIRIFKQAAKYVCAYLEGYPVYWSINTRRDNSEEGKSEEIILVIRAWLPVDYITEEKMEKGEVKGDKGGLRKTEQGQRGG